MTEDDMRSLLRVSLDLSEEQPIEVDAFAEIEGWDSLGHMRFIIAVEEACGIELTGEEIVSAVSFSALRSILDTRSS